MSETPRTDEIIADDGTAYFVRLDRMKAHARQLERELAAERAQRVAAEARARELERDAERLDSRAIVISERDDFGDVSKTLHTDIDLRAAIDAAQKEGASK